MVMLSPPLVFVIGYPIRLFPSYRYPILFPQVKKGNSLWLEEIYPNARMARDAIFGVGYVIV